MKLVLISIFASFAFSCSANLGKILIFPFTLTSSEVDSTLPISESVYEFKFVGIADSNFTIIYSVDGIDAQAKITPNSRLLICVKPGKHVFQFYTWHYREIFIDSLPIESQHRDIYEVKMSYAYSVRKVAKPVIYLYPEEPTEVKVSLAIFGENPFYYPAYDNAWEGTAMPNGDFHIADKVYNYLFWEEDDSGISLLHREGFIVPKNGVVQFLEKHLTTAGFNSKEQADFITFWGPQLMQNEHSFIQFVFNEACNEYAELNISPTPDNIYRIYMLWHPSDILFEVSEQIIEPMNREGFTVLEWGGIEVSTIITNEVQ